MLHGWMLLGKNGGGRLVGCENSVKNEENGLRWYIQNSIETITSCSQNK